MNKMRKLSLIVLLSITFTLSAQLKINELMPKNVSAVWDDAFDFSMWAEVYNDSQTTISLGDFYFSDDKTNPKKWRLPNQKLEPHAFATFWFEREEKKGHVNFKLDPEGATLYIYDKTGYTIDKIKYPEQRRNISYGRLQDGGDDWGFFIEHSFNASNNTKITAIEICEAPKPNYEPGFFTSNINLKFETPTAGESIHYTLDSSEPTKASPKYTKGTSIPITKTTVVRAIAISENKLASDYFSGTYFVRERDFKLPVVSLISDKMFLTDNTYGIYVVGTNGTTGECPGSSPANYFQDWDRPANFEFFNEDKLLQISQELDMKLAGGCSRQHPLKSLKLNPKKKHGDNQFQFDFFSETKPNRKLNGLFYRNSGNDFSSTMFRDAYMQALIRNRLDMENQAYLPTVCFINGEYRGIQNLRETSNHRNIFSNYNLKEEEVMVVDNYELSSHTEFQKMVTYARSYDIKNDIVFNTVSKMIDVDSYLDYMMAQIYFNNGDWPHNNMKMWKAIDNGIWRPIIFDTDFGFGLFGLPHSTTKNAIRYVLEENMYRENGNENVYMLRRLMENEKFKWKFIDRFMLHISTTFESNRALQLLDAMSSQISEEIVYHKKLYNQNASSFTSGVNSMRNFANNRPGEMRNMIADFFKLGRDLYDLNISSNIEEASYVFNGQNVVDADLNIKYFKNREVELQANPVNGYRFKHWELLGNTSSVNAIIKGDEWHYWDEYGVPSTDWFTLNYDDSAWKTGMAQFGWGRGEVTKISYGPDPNNKYITSYYRKEFDIENINGVSQANMKLFIDDGVVIYVNGVELARYNMPEGEVDFDTKALVFNNGVNIEYNVPVSMLKEGTNLIAVELHQEKLTTSDAIFDLSFSYNQTASSNSNVVKTENYSFTLSKNLAVKAVYEIDDDFTEERIPRVFVNEILSAKSEIRDEFGNKDDYIELYNDEDEAVNVAGWFISDTPIAPKMYQIPSTDEELTTIQPKSYLILWADKEPEQGPLHTNFSLSKNGEFVVLSKMTNYGELQTVDIVRFPVLGEEETYSRFPDGSDNWVVQGTTFSASNSGATVVEQERVGLSLYPSLVRDVLHVDNQEGKLIRIYNVSGVQHYAAIIASDKEIINLSQLSSGMYIVQVGKESAKIIKE